MNELIKELSESLGNTTMDNNTKDLLIQRLCAKLESTLNTSFLQDKLRILYEYEKNYLDLIKEYKEEIKFAATIQEDLRKERTKFFSEALKEVSATLKEAQVDSNVASVWIKELVDSNTKSLDISSGLIEEHTIEMIGEVRQEAKKEAKQVGYPVNTKKRSQASEGEPQETKKEVKQVKEKNAQE